jgi:RNase H-like domain found in reverse transcriptase/Integrase zinc binding domain/Chromo (CHRromatin Organisation MOdifier) domain
MASRAKERQGSVKHPGGPGVSETIHPSLHALTVAHPLNELLKKNKKFEWTKECTQVVDALIKAVTSNPVLLCPDFKKPFVLEVDASQFSTGAILYQQDSEEHWCPVGYYSKSFNEAERGYDIHDWELLAIVQGIDHWWHLLLSSPFKVTVISDHLNLKYYWEPRKINQRVARYLPKLGEFNLQIIHKPGKTNKADLLSQWPNFDQGKNDNEEVLVLPPELFINAVQVHQTLEELVLNSQGGKEEELKCLREEVGLQSRDNGWVKNTALVVMDPSLYKNILELYHDHPSAGHPGILKMLTMILADYWWPGVWDFVTKYVQGCTICQSTKSGTTWPKVPLMPITAKQAAPPFTTIALDLITDLPLSNEHNSILTITDHDCSKAAIFIPCSKTVDAEGIAQLYAQYIFPHYGVPQKVISDQDPRFTAKFMRELCKQLCIDQNISSVYHLQTDGQSEQTNQWLEQYLQIYGNFQQNDWASWLPLAQFVHNAWPSDVTKTTPFDLLIGYTPCFWQTKTTLTLPELAKHKEWLTVMREQVQVVIKRAQDMVLKRNKQLWGRKVYKPYEEGDLVWLDGKNLRTSHPMTKLAPKRFGPFKVMKVINPMSFQLGIPAQWRQKKIHPMFHASLLSPHKEMEEHGENFPEPPPDLVEGEEEFKVEQILASRQHGHGKKLQYLLRWKGYSQAHNNWEPADQVHAEDLIERFHRENPEAIRCMDLKDEEIQGGDNMTPTPPITNADRSSSPSVSLISEYSFEVPTSPLICRHPSPGPIERANPSGTSMSSNPMPLNAPGLPLLWR